MNMLKKISAIFLFVVMAAVSFNANAATVPLSCNWQLTYIHGGAWGAYFNYVCYDNGVLAASKVIGVDAYAGQCTVHPQTGYSYSGSACDPTILKTVPDTEPPQACGPNAGQLYGDVYVNNNPHSTGDNRAFPTAEVNAFCGACGYNTSVLGSGAWWAWLRVTCKN
jgi:hypothetical protein